MAFDGASLYRVRASLGFHVMLYTLPMGVDMTSPDYASLQQYQVKAPLTLQPEVSFGFAVIDPAASASRSLFIARISPAIQTLDPDAIHLDSTIPISDGNGLIDGKNFQQGWSQLETDLLTAFPNLVLGVEQVYDSIAAQASFAEPPYWSSGSNLSSEVSPPVPIASYSMPNVKRYWHLGVANPPDPGFITNLEQYEGQAVLPTFHNSGGKVVFPASRRRTWPASSASQTPFRPTNFNLHGTQTGTGP